MMTTPTTPKNKTTLTVEPGKQEILITREFDAPCELVYRALTDPRLLVQWLGPREMAMRIDVFEPHSGGCYRYIHTDPQGHEFAFHGVFHEVSPQRIIQTFEFEGLPESGHVSLETAQLEPLPGGRTRLMMHSIYRSVADRDGMVESGMERGVREGYERLDDVLAKL